ncbi:MAG: Druantia anti-phage system protein DruA, partial [Candidatus Desantisbacteria bacterium]
MEQNGYNLTIIEKATDRLAVNLSVAACGVSTAEQCSIQANKENSLLKLENLKVESSLQELGEIELIRVNNAKDKHYQIWKMLIEKYHYLGHGKLYGLQIRYLIKSERLGWIGAISFSSPA